MILVFVCWWLLYFSVGGEVTIKILSVTPYTLEYESNMEKNVFCEFYSDDGLQFPCYEEFCECAHGYVQLIIGKRVYDITVYTDNQTVLNKISFVAPPVENIKITNITFNAVEYTVQCSISDSHTYAKQSKLILTNDSNEFESNLSYEFSNTAIIKSLNKQTKYKLALIDAMEKPVTHTVDFVTAGLPTECRYIFNKDELRFVLMYSGPAPTFCSYYYEYKTDDSNTTATEVILPCNDEEPRIHCSCETFYVRPTYKLVDYIKEFGPVKVHVRDFLNNTLHSFIVKKRYTGHEMGYCNTCNQEEYQTTLNSYELAAIIVSFSACLIIVMLIVAMAVHRKMRRRNFGTVDNAEEAHITNEKGNLK